MHYRELYRLVDLVEAELMDEEKYDSPPQPAMREFMFFVKNYVRGSGHHPEAAVPSEVRMQFWPSLAWYRHSVEYVSKK